MATGGYVGAGGARKLKSCQVGVGGVHKVKEIWGGFNGTTKRVWRGTIPAGQKVFTSSQTWTVPEGVKVIDVFCVGGGQSGARETTVSAPGTSYNMGTKGGCGGYTATLKNVSVTVGQGIPIVIGAGGNTPTSDGLSIGADTSCLSCIAKGAGQYERLPGTWWTGLYGGSGGGYPGGRQSSYDEYYEWNGGDAGAGGSDGGNGYTNRPNRVDDNGSIYVFEGGKGQVGTTRAFGESGNTLYAGGGGGGGAVWNGYTSWAYNFGAGGNGGGGRGGWYEESISGTANTGGGGGGGGFAHYDNSGSTRYPGGNGGSGVCIIRWAEQ